MSAIKKPEFFYAKNGKPVKVLLDIKLYQQMLEELEDLEDIRDLEEMRKKPLNLRKFSDFLAEQKKNV